MQPINELKQLREQMAEQLTQIPEYQALKALERFIGELTSIYEGGAALGNAAPPAKSAPVVVDAGRKKDGGASSPRVTPYIPAHRVA